MDRFANSANAPDFDASQILRRTRRRRTIGVAAVAAALIAAGGGTALATSVAGGSSSTPAATSAATNSAATNSDATSSDATTMLYLFSNGQSVPIDFAGWSQYEAKRYMQKTQTTLGTVTEKAVKGCKPGSVLGVSPHAPKTVKKGDTVDFTVCAG
ncbi:MULTISPECIES: PASTA domain-containing protein [unclassified Streptomyces]|uniref:PASTA domain-containing protein n=1 Tax=unclassified Streptomyces TaxID=2593676 RepID=UPI001F08332F|nr:PASTA domain-containing protein [Streptomyces sp. CB09001]